MKDSGSCSQMMPSCKSPINARMSHIIPVYLMLNNRQCHLNSYMAIHTKSGLLNMLGFTKYFFIFSV